MSYKPITNITIAHVPNDRAVIALLLEYLQVCKTRKICVMPDFKRNQLCYTAYIEVAEWCDREVAYNLIQKIKDPRKEARIVYEDDNWWAVEETAEEDLRFTKSANFAQWTTEFKQQIKDEVYDYEEKKQVSFKRGVQIEESISIEDLDMRTAILAPDFNFDDFCIGFGLAHGFDFEAEFKEWTEEKLIAATEENLKRLEAKDVVIEVESNS
jgi:hypothetical protein